MCRGNNTYVNIDRLRRAHRPHGTVLQHTQQLRLQRQRHVAYLIEKQAATISCLKQPLLRGGGTGERAFRVPEQLALQQLLGNSRAVDRHEWLG